MKKVISLVLCIIFSISALTGCSYNGEPFQEKSYTPDEQVDSIDMDVRDREALLFTFFDVSDEFCEEPSSPSSLFPIIFDVRNVALETTPNRRASPVTATAFGIFLCGFFSFGGCCGSC